MICDCKMARSTSYVCSHCVVCLHHYGSINLVEMMRPLTVNRKRGRKKRKRPNCLLIEKEINMEGSPDCVTCGSDSDESKDEAQLVQPSGEFVRQGVYNPGYGFGYVIAHFVYMNPESWLLWFPNVIESGTLPCGGTLVRYFMRAILMRR